MRLLLECKSYIAVPEHLSECSGSETTFIGYYFFFPSFNLNLADAVKGHIYTIKKLCTMPENRLNVVSKPSQD